MVAPSTNGPHTSSRAEIVQGLHADHPLEGRDVILLDTDGAVVHRRQT